MSLIGRVPMAASPMLPTVSDRANSCEHGTGQFGVRRFDAAFVFFRRPVIVPPRLGKQKSASKLRTPKARAQISLHLWVEKNGHHVKCSDA